MVLRSFKSDAVLSIFPTETGQSPRSPMSIRLPCRGHQKQVKLAMDVVERKEAMQEKSENDARKD